MTKFVSDVTFSAYVTEDFTWRVKEISDLRKAANAVSDGYEIPIRKGGIALIYAHWEGYIKFVSEAYIKFVSVRKMKFSHLSDEFFAVEIGSALRRFSSSDGSFRNRIAFLNDLRALEKGQFRRIRDKGFSTGGNLNFQRFSEVCDLFNINPEKVVRDRIFLDERILGVRNKIAHGGSITVTQEELAESSDFVVEIMRNFRSEVELCLIEQRYLKQRTRKSQKKSQATPSARA